MLKKHFLLQIELSLPLPKFPVNFDKWGMDLYLVFEVHIYLNKIITYLCRISLTLISIGGILTIESFRVF